jgi:hypothetical protein
VTHRIARHARTVTLFAVLGAVGLSACGGGSKHVSSTSAAASPATASSSGAAGAAADPATTTAVTTAFVTFFNGTTPIAQRLTYLQNADAFAQALAAQANNPLISQTSATVSVVSLSGTGRANVTYSVGLSGTPVLPNQSGIAVLVNGGWKVSAGTFCGLFALEGQSLPLCAQASVTALPS